MEFMVFRKHSVFSERNGLIRGGFSAYKEALDCAKNAEELFEINSKYHHGRGFYYCEITSYSA